MFDTKTQLADMLTNGTFTRDEWNQLLRLLNIMNLSMFSCSHFIPLKNSKSMLKRSMHERKPREEPALAKSKPMSLVSKRVSVNQSLMLESGISHSPKNYGMPSWNSDLTSTEKFGRDSNENEASSSQVWHRSGNPRPCIEKSRRNVNQRSSTEKSGRDVQNRLTETRLTHQNLQIVNRPYLEKVFSNVQKKMNRPEDDQMLDLKVSVVIWRLSMSATMQAAMHPRVRS